VICLPRSFHLFFCQETRLAPPLGSTPNPLSSLFRFFLSRFCYVSVSWVTTFFWRFLVFSPFPCLATCTPFGHVTFLRGFFFPLSFRSVPDAPQPPGSSNFAPNSLLQIRDCSCLSHVFHLALHLITPFFSLKSYLPQVVLSASRNSCPSSRSLLLWPQATFDFMSFSSPSVTLAFLSLPIVYKLKKVPTVPLTFWARILTLVSFGSHRF